MDLETDTVVGQLAYAVAETSTADLGPTIESTFWSDHQGDEEICVAVLDGAADLLHPCFEGALVETLGGEWSGAMSVHGTHTASLIFGQPGSRVRGVAPRCRGLLIPVFRSFEPGRPPGCSQQELAAAIERAVDAGAHIINVSGGHLTPGGEAEPELADAVRRCERQRVLLVAAAGNEGCRCLHVPAALSSVLAVGALDLHDRPMERSNWGDLYREAGVVAPGQAIVGAIPGGEIEPRTGTSCATAIVSGIAALLLSRQRERGQTPDPLRVRQAILESVDPCDPAMDGDCRRVLAGAVNVFAAERNLWAHDRERREIREITAADDSEVTMNETTETGVESCRTEQVPATKMELSTPPAVQPSTVGVGAGTAAQERGDEMSDEMETDTAGSPDQEPMIEPSSASEGGAEAPPQVIASDQPSTGACSCSGSQLVYFIGEVGFDYGSQTRLDAFDQAMGEDQSAYDPADLLDYLGSHQSSAASVIWTLGWETIPTFAVASPGPYGSEGYEFLRNALNGQLAGTVLRVSVPGNIKGKVRLLSGMEIPVIVPDLRGLNTWTVPKAEAKGGPAARAIANFLDRIFYELRSRGTASDDRAINFASTLSYVTDGIFEKMAKQKMELEAIRAKDTPVCRPGSICRDVVLSFFDPQRRYERARQVWRYTIDVSDTVPARIGPVRTWSEY